MRVRRAERAPATTAATEEGVCDDDKCADDGCSMAALPPPTRADSTVVDCFQSGFSWCAHRNQSEGLHGNIRVRRKEGVANLQSEACRQEMGH